MNRRKYLFKNASVHTTVTGKEKPKTNPILQNCEKASKWQYIMHSFSKHVNCMLYSLDSIMRRSGAFPTAHSASNLVAESLIRTITEKESYATGVQSRSTQQNLWQWWERTPRKEAPSMLRLKEEQALGESRDPQEKEKILPPACARSWRW